MTLPPLAHSLATQASPEESAPVEMAELETADLELPSALPSPFDELGPHPLAQRATEQLRAQLKATGQLAPGVPTSLLETAEGGKMLGVLVVRDAAGRLGFLKAFSGTLGGRWLVPGFAPPLFDVQARAQLEVPGEAGVKRLCAQTEALRQSPERLRLRAELEGLLARQAKADAELRERHRGSRERRRSERRNLEQLEPTEQVREQLQALDQQSRGDKAERRRAEVQWKVEREALEGPLRRLERKLRAAERLQSWASRVLMRRLHEGYQVRNARGEQRSLRTLFSGGEPSPRGGEPSPRGGEPPSGAGDCAGAKLLAWALAQGLTPVALAESWWGRAPASGGRRDGAYYPACKAKCGPVLPFLLEGLEVLPPRRFRPARAVRRELDVLFEDDWLWVLRKPAGLLSVPGRDDHVDDSLWSRLCQATPESAARPLLVHRLDLDTSGLLVAAKTRESYLALQRQFLRREVEKGYVAWVEGEVALDGGILELPIRVDLEDRPRQVVDPVHGKRAVTHWRRLEVREGLTRVELVPITGRTHQLRVHAAHPSGLAAPIVGDRLYGRGGGPAWLPERLMLHAQRLAFRHPSSGRSVSFDWTAPF